MMSAQQVTIGSENKGDCLITVAPSASLKIEIKAGNARLVERGIRAVIEATVGAMGITAAKVTVMDRGALDYVLSARMETALQKAFPEIASPIQRTVAARATVRDRLRRSRLYAPGNNPRLLAGIDLHDADCILLDLEDSVPLQEKSAARILVKHLLITLDLPEAWVRINPLSSYGDDDLDGVMLGRPHGICLPKAESAADVEALSQALSEQERELGIPAGSAYIMPIIETAKGILHAEEICSADERVVMVSFGAEDFTRDMGAKRTHDSLLFARSMIVAAAKSARIQASDTVYADIADEAGLITETKLARDLGFDGKGAVNPRQIEPIHRVFSPSEEEIEEAMKVIAAAEEAEKKGMGAVALGGKMIDRPVLERARRTLKLADNQLSDDLRVEKEVEGGPR
jgi:citrate lyase subunit beta/citryl-CoA lyase